MSKPKIFVFCAGRIPDTYARFVGKAVAEDGTELGVRHSSTTRWLKLDMGIHSSGGMHEKYAAHYPNGYELVWVEHPDNFAPLRAAIDCRDATSESQQS